MPTAVERLLDSFLKFTGLRGQGALNEAAFKLDEAFLKLSTANADNFLKIEGSPFVKIDFDRIGDSFVKLGADFHRLTVAGEAVDQVLLKLTGGTTVGSDDPRAGAQADFVALDHKVSTTSTDLKILGTDFLKLDTAPNVASFVIKGELVADDFLKLSTDTAADRVAFLKLSADILKLSQGVDATSPLDRALKQLGGELQAVGDTFGLLSTDFLKVGDAVAHGAGGGGGSGLSTNVNGAGGGGGAGDSIGAALTLLYQHFHTLDVKLEALGDGSVRLINDLLPAVDQGTSKLFSDNSQHGNGHG
jgi:hypothetical protein